MLLGKRDVSGTSESMRYTQQMVHEGGLCHCLEPSVPPDPDPDPNPELLPANKPPPKLLVPKPVFVGWPKPTVGGTAGQIGNSK